MYVWFVSTTGCDYFGTTYVLGQHFIGTDGCSNCYCGANGEIACDNSPCSKYMLLLILTQRCFSFRRDNIITFKSNLRLCTNHVPHFLSSMYILRNHVCVWSVLRRWWWLQQMPLWYGGPSDLWQHALQYVLNHSLNREHKLWPIILTQTYLNKRSRATRRSHAIFCFYIWINWRLLCMYIDLLNSPQCLLI